MPDWSYRTVSRPVLFRLPARKARDLVLHAIGTLARIPGGKWVIDFTGHMRPDASLGTKLGNHSCPSPVGLGIGIDPHVVATAALARMGMGFVEIGPVTEEAQPTGDIQLDPSEETITLAGPAENPGLDTVQYRLERRHCDVPILARIHVSSGQRLIEKLAPHVAGFTIHVDTPDSIAECVAAVRDLVDRHENRDLFLVAPVDASDEFLDVVRQLIAEKQLNGVLLDGSLRTSSSTRRMSRDSIADVLASTWKCREILGPAATLIVSGGIHEPLQALQLLDAGANLLQVDSGFVFSGPGLVKRINEAVRFRLGESSPTASRSDEPRLAQQSWFWSLLMGLAMFAGGLMALVIASTRVVMPYDEAIVGMSRDEIAAVNDRLLSFMAHDRVTLAGTMISVGILYSVLSWFGTRRGHHWTHVAISASAFSGFASFFLFLGFGYFDPFHAFVAVVLLQLLLMAVHSRILPLHGQTGPDLINDPAWRRSQWGQLLFVIHGVILIVAGTVISTVGITQVFVPEDLEFMQTTAEHLHGAHPQLVPLIAHDRASFGGMLIACGVTVLLSALWGFRRGCDWLWWALLIGGNIAYLATIAVHLVVGYTSPMHLLPAFGGLGLLWAGCGFSYAYLCVKDERHRNLWDDFPSA